MVGAVVGAVVVAVAGADVSPTLVGAAVVGAPVEVHWELLLVGAALVGQLFVATCVLQVVLNHDCSLHVDVSPEPDNPQLDVAHT